MLTLWNYLWNYIFLKLIIINNISHTCANQFCALNCGFICGGGCGQTVSIWDVCGWPFALTFSWRNKDFMGLSSCVAVGVLDCIPGIFCIPPICCISCCIGSTVGGCVAVVECGFDVKWVSGCVLA